MEVLFLASFLICFFVLGEMSWLGFEVTTGIRRRESRRLGECCPVLGKLKSFSRKDHHCLEMSLWAYPEHFSHL